MGKDDSALMIEYFDDKFAALLEGVESIIDRKLQPVADNVTELKSDMKAVKAAVTDTNQDIIKLQNDVADLQTA